MSEFKLGWRCPLASLTGWQSVCVLLFGCMWTCLYVPGPLAGPQMAWNRSLMWYYLYPDLHVEPGADMLTPNVWPIHLYPQAKKGWTLSRLKIPFPKYSQCLQFNYKCAQFTFWNIYIFESCVNHLLFAVDVYNQSERLRVIWNDCWVHYVACVSLVFHLISKVPQWKMNLDCSHWIQVTTFSTQ